MFGCLVKRRVRPESAAVSIREDSRQGENRAHTAGGARPENRVRRALAWPLRIEYEPVLCVPSKRLWSARADARLAGRPDEPDDQDEEERRTGTRL